MSAKKLGSNQKPCWKCFQEFFRSIEQSGPLDENVSHLLDKWAKEHAASSQRAKSVAHLKAELQRYEFELAVRKMKQRANEMHAKKHKRKLTTDDRLPYELQPISTNWKTALSRLHMLKTPTTTNVKQVKKVQVGKKSPAQDQSRSRSLSRQKKTLKFVVPPSTEVKQPNEQITQIMPSSPVLIPSSPVEDSENTPSSSISSDSATELMKSCHLTELLAEIMKDAEKSDRSDEIPIETNNLDFANVSRNDLNKFEKIILENTKDSLLTSQPTDEELERWFSADGGDRVEFGLRYKIIKFSRSPVEIKDFCTSCLPRHWDRNCNEADVTDEQQNSNENN